MNLHPELNNSVRSIKRVVSLAHLRVLIAGVMMLTLTACEYLNPFNWFGDDEVNPPVELYDIEAEVSLSRLWSVKVGNGQGKNYTMISPVIDGGVIYAASENGFVVAVELSTGNELWRERIEATIGGGVGAGEGLVMVGTQDAEVIALDQATGVLKWRRSVSSEVLSAPQSDGDIVVAQTVDGKLVALDFEDGNQRWTYETNMAALSLRGTSSPVITSQNSVIAGFSNGTLVSVSADEGVLLWEERVAVPEGQYDIDRVIDVDGKLLLDGQRVLAASYQGNLMAFDVATGRIVWGKEASSYHGMDQGFGNIYYADDRSHVIAIRDNTDELVWENYDLRYRSLTAPRTISNYVAVADFEGYVHLLSQIDGRLVGRTRVDSDGVRASMLANDGALYIYDNGGALTAWSLQ